MPATSSRTQSTPSDMTRHRTLRRAMASASAKMPRRLCREVRKSRDCDCPHRVCRRQAPLHGASGARRPSMECPQRHDAITQRLITWRVNELYGAHWLQRRRRCRVKLLLSFSVRARVHRHLIQLCVLAGQGHGQPVRSTLTTDGQMLTPLIGASDENTYSD